MNCSLSLCKRICVGSKYPKRCRQPTEADPVLCLPRTNVLEQAHPSFDLPELSGFNSANVPVTSPHEFFILIIQRNIFRITASKKMLAANRGGSFPYLPRRNVQEHALPSLGSMRSSDLFSKTYEYFDPKYITFENIDKWFSR